MELKTYNHIIDNLQELDIDYENGKILNRSEHLDGSNYLCITLKGKKPLVHQIIAVLKYGSKCVGLTVNHMDGDKYNNTPANLELCTQADNNRHAYAKGLNPRLKLTKELVKDIKRLYADGLIMQEIADIHGITRHTVSRAIKKGG